MIIVEPCGRALVFKPRTSVKNGVAVDEVVVNLANSPFVLSELSSAAIPSSNDSIFVNKVWALLRIIRLVNENVLRCQICSFSKILCIKKLEGGVLLGEQ